MGPRRARWKVLFLSLECADPIFSGNGVYARTLIRALTGLEQQQINKQQQQQQQQQQQVKQQERPTCEETSAANQGGGAQVLVLCGCPEGQRDSKVGSGRSLAGIGGVTEKDAPGWADGAAVRLLSVTVPIWYRLDRESSWKEYGLGVSKHVDAVLDFKPDIVLCVDWTSTLALQTLKSLNALPHTPAVFLNFRVFSASTGISQSDRKFYREREALALRLCQESIALCEHDASLLHELDKELNALNQGWGDKEEGTKAPVIKPQVLNPSLRAEMRALAARRKSLTFKHARQLSLYRKTVREPALGGAGKGAIASRSRHGMQSPLSGTSERAPPLGDQGEGRGVYSRSQSMDGLLETSGTAVVTGRGDDRTPNAGRNGTGSAAHDLAGGEVTEVPLKDDAPSNMRERAFRRHQSAAVATTRSGRGGASAQGGGQRALPRVDSFNSEGDFSGGGVEKVAHARDLTRNIQHGFGGPRPIVLSYLKSQRYNYDSQHPCGKKRYLTCCCRISPEKNVEQFISVLGLLRDFLLEHRIVPCLVGPPTNNDFANKVYKELDALFPGTSSKVVPRFVPAAELSAIYGETLLNFHPAVYEAYGMSIVEAAAFGTPTVMNSSGIGAADLLSAPHAAVLCDMTNPKSCAVLIRSLLDPSRADLLASIGACARAKAMAWNDAKFSARLFSLMEGAVKNRFRSYDYACKSPIKPVRNRRTSSSSTTSSTSSSIATKNGGGGAAKSLKANLFRNAPRGASTAVAKADRAQVEGVKRKSVAPLQDEWLWSEVLAWTVAYNVAHNRADQDLIDEKVMSQADLAAIQHIGLSIASLSQQDFIKRIEAEWESAIKAEYREVPGKGKADKRAAAKAQAKQRMEKTNPEHLTKWASHFMDESKFFIGKARYKLVPSRIPELGFWGCMFALIRKAITAQYIQGGVMQALQNAAETALTQSRAESEPAHEAGYMVRSLANAADSQAALESVAAALCECPDNLLLITGSPSLRNNPITPQKADGPLATVLLLRAYAGLGDLKKRARVLTEQINSFALQGCMGVFFGAGKVNWQGNDRLRHFSEETLYSADNLDICVETFAGGRGFMAPQLERLQSIASEIGGQDSSSSSSICICVERVGPSSQGVCFARDGEPIQDKHLAPLHEVLAIVENLAPAGTVQTAAIVAAGANKVGMGSEVLEDAIATCIPLGEQQRCVVATDSVIVGAQSTLAAFALTCAVALTAASKGLIDKSEQSLDRIVASRDQLLEGLEATYGAGSFDRAVQSARAKTVEGLSFDAIASVCCGMRQLVLDEWHVE